MLNHPLGAWTVEPAMAPARAIEVIREAKRNCHFVFVERETPRQRTDRRRCVTAGCDEYHAA
jgi:hypothetical protein